MFFLNLAIIAVTFVQVTAACWISPPTAGNSYRGGMLEKRYAGLGCSASSKPIPYYYNLKNIVGVCVKQDGVHAGKWGKRSVGSYTYPNTGKTKKGTFKYIYLDAACTQPDPTQTGSPNCSGCDTCPDPVNNDDIDWEVNVCVNTAITSNGGYSMTKTFTTELLSAKPGYGSAFVYGTQDGCQTKNNEPLDDINLTKPDCNPGDVAGTWRSATCTGTMINVYSYTDQFCTEGEELAQTYTSSTCVEFSTNGPYVLLTCGTTPPKTCDQGSMPSSDNTSCVKCPAGKFGADGKTCTICPVGKYSEGTGNTTCKVCDTAKTTGSTTCGGDPDDTTSDGDIKPKSKTGTVLLFLVVAFGFFFGGGYYTLIYLPEKQKAEVLAARDAKLAREAAEAPATTNPVHENGINPMNNA
jgi:hypothetical protein